MAHRGKVRGERASARPDGGLSRSTKERLAALQKKRAESHPTIPIALLEALRAVVSEETVTSVAACGSRIFHFAPTTVQADPKRQYSAVASCKSIPWCPACTLADHTRSARFLSLKLQSLAVDEDGEPWTREEIPAILLEVEPPRSLWVWARREPRILNEVIQAFQDAVPDLLGVAGRHGKNKRRHTWERLGAIATILPLWSEWPHWSPSIRILLSSFHRDDGVLQPLRVDWLSDDGVTHAITASFVKRRQGIRSPSGAASRWMTRLRRPRIDSEDLIQVKVRRGPDGEVARVQTMETVRSATAPMIDYSRISAGSIGNIDDIGRDLPRLIGSLKAVNEAKRTMAKIDARVHMGTFSRRSYAKIARSLVRDPARYRGRKDVSVAGEYDVASARLRLTRAGKQFERETRKAAEMVQEPQQASDLAGPPGERKARVATPRKPSNPKAKRDRSRSSSSRA